MSVNSLKAQKHDKLAIDFCIAIRCILFTFNFYAKIRMLLDLICILQKFHVFVFCCGILCSL